jgi:hypothetical protein
VYWLSCCTAVIMSSAASRHWESCISAAAEDLSNAAEISFAMEVMLDDLEILQHVNESKRLQRELAECKRTIQKLQEAEAKLLAEQAAATAKLDAERATAGALKDSFAKELWALTKELRAKEQQKQQLDELQERVAVLPQLQAELQQARTALAEMEAIAVENAVSLPVSNSAAAGNEADDAADAIAASLQSESALPAEAEAAVVLAAVASSQSRLLALPDKSQLAVYSYLEMSDVTSVAATCSAAYCKVCTIDHQVFKDTRYHDVLYKLVHCCPNMMILASKPSSVPLSVVRLHCNTLRSYLLRRQMHCLALARAILFSAILYNNNNNSKQIQLKLKLQYQAIVLAYCMLLPLLPLQQL